MFYIGKRSGRRVSNPPPDHKPRALAVILTDTIQTMRNETEIKNLILDFAKNDDRVRVVLLNGSRANPNIHPDKLQDYDLVFITDDIKSFLSNHNWTNVFGEKLIFQLPNEMTFGEDVKQNNEINSFAYLMIFKDGNRIDLTLFPIQKFKTGFIYDSLTIVWLDKDNLFTQVQLPNDQDYHIRKPTEKYFLDTCNEFWWVSTYVAKGLLRNEITYSKEMLETAVRPMFMKMLEWKISEENGFSVSFGKAGKLLCKYLTKDNYGKVLQTYSDFDTENNWTSLFIMTSLFKKISTELSLKLKFHHDKDEQENTINYLRHLHDEQKNGS